MKKDRIIPFFLVILMIILMIDAMSFQFNLGIWSPGLLILIIVFLKDKYPDNKISNVFIRIVCAIILGIVIFDLIYSIKLDYMFS